jgi:hypothetical protein
MRQRIAHKECPKLNNRAMALARAVRGAASMPQKKVTVTMRVE